MQQGGGKGMIRAKVVASLCCSAVVAAGGATVLASPANADDVWSAIAWSPSTRVIGEANGYPAEGGPDSGVAQRAVQECANNAQHPTDCRWLASAKCVALAQTADAYNVGMGATSSEAVDKARMPGMTAQIVWVCSGGLEPAGKSGTANPL